MIKRIFDLFLSILLLLIFSPILIILFCLIYLDNPGPIFFSQNRIGKNGKIFRLYKLRSMKINSEKNGPIFTLQNDKRVTKFGKFIRKTSFDELPQLVNVIVGDMSVVGPRPDVPEQKRLYSENDWNLRNSLQPGITGLAQSINRNSGTLKQRLKLDLFYIKKSNILLDMKIICLTIKQIFSKGSF